MKRKTIIRVSRALICLAIASLIGSPVFSQARTNHSRVYLYVDSIPRFPGGANGLEHFLEKNLKWPDPTLDVAGYVLLSFVVLSDGHIANVKIEKPLFPAFDAEAIRLVKSMPKWVPGKVGNKVVDVKMYFPVDFNVVNK